MKLSILKKKFKNQWVLAEVLKEDRLNRLIELEPIKASESRNEVYEALMKIKPGKHVATLYTGKLPPRGMVYAF